MSTAKFNHFQVGQNNTATQNFVVTQGADGSGKIARGNQGATTQDIITWDAAGKVSAPTGFSIPYFWGREVQSTGVNAGTFTSGADRTRVINTIEVNEIGATLVSNQITLLAGTYELDASATYYGNTDGNQALWYNVTDASVTIRGQNRQGQSGSGSSPVKGKFTITTTKTFELRHRCLTTVATNGLGSQTGTGSNEHYSEVILRKVS